MGTADPSVIGSSSSGKDGRVTGFARVSRGDLIGFRQVLCLRRDAGRKGTRLSSFNDGLKRNKFLFPYLSADSYFFFPGVFDRKIDPMRR